MYMDEHTLVFEINYIAGTQHTIVQAFELDIRTTIIRTHILISRTLQMLELLHMHTIFKKVDFYNTKYYFRKPI